MRWGVARSYILRDSFVARCIRQQVPCADVVIDVITNQAKKRDKD